MKIWVSGTVTVVGRVEFKQVLERSDGMLGPSKVPEDWVLGYFGAGEKRGRLPSLASLLLLLWLRRDNRAVCGGLSRYVRLLLHVSKCDGQAGVLVFYNSV